MDILNLYAEHYKAIKAADSSDPLLEQLRWTATVAAKGELVGNKNVKKILTQLKTVLQSQEVYDKVNDPNLNGQRRYTILKLLVSINAAANRLNPDENELSDVVFGMARAGINPDTLNQVRLVMFCQE